MLERKTSANRISLKNSRGSDKLSPTGTSHSLFQKSTRVLDIGSSFFLLSWFYLWVFRLVSVCRSVRDVRFLRIRLPPALTAAHNGALLERAWAAELSRVAENGPASNTKKHSGGKKQLPTGQQPSLLRALRTAFQTRFLLLSIWKLLWGVFTWVGASVILFQFVKTCGPPVDPNDSNDPKSDTNAFNTLIIMSVVFLVTSLLSSICIHQLYGECNNEGYRVKSALTVLVYKKALVLARVKGGAGEVINIVSSDISRIQDAASNFHFLWTSVIETIAILALASYYLNFDVVASLVAVAIIIALIPLQLYLGSITSRLQRETTDVTTLRVHLMSEILTAIKLIKFYAWETPFSERVAEIRKREVALLRSALRVKAVNFTVVFATPVIVAIAGLAIVSRGSLLNASYSFTVLSIFNTLRYPLLMLPQAVKSVSGARVSLLRITAFLTQNEIKPLAVLPPPPPSLPSPSMPIPSPTPSNSGDDSSKAGSVVPRPGTPMLQPQGSPVPHVNDSLRQLSFELNNASFTWEGETSPALHNLTLKARRGDLIAVIGDVGSGKSSLIAALLGQIAQTSGDPIRIYGTTSYVPQEAWLLNFTLRENILFGSPYNEETYNKVIHVCALERDLTLLAAGDETEIAERGANLSGGQRQRASLARAVYTSADIVLLDDPLSAVDQAVGRHIFSECIKSYLSERTVIMVTHQLQYLEQVDLVVQMKAGKIVRQGTFDHLMQNDPEFADLINSHVAAGEQGDDDVEAMPLNPVGDDVVSVEVPASCNVEGPIPLNEATVKSIRNLHIQFDPNTISSMVEREQLAVIRNADHSHDVAAAILRNELTVHSVQEERMAAEIGHYVTSMSSLNVAEGSDGKNQDDENSKNFLANSQARMAQSGSMGLTEANSEPKNIDAASSLNRKAGGSQKVSEVRGQLVGEDTSASSVGWRNYRIYSVVGNGIFVAILLVLFFFGTHGIRVGSDTYLREWILSTDVSKTSTYVGTYGGLIAAFTTCIFLRGWFFANEAAYKAQILHDKMFTRIMRAPMSFFDSTPLGRILSAFAKHQFHIDETLPDALLQALQYIPLTIGAIVIVSIFVSYAVWTTLGVFLLGFMLVAWSTPAENMLKSGEAATKPPIFSHLAVTLEGLFSIRAYNAQARFALINQQRLDANHGLGISLAQLKSWTALYLDIATSIVIFLVAIMSTLTLHPAKDSFGRKNDSSNAGLALSNALQILVFLQWSVRMVGDIQAQISSVGVIDYYSTQIKQEAPAEVPATCNPAPKNWPRTGEIEFKNVVLKYHEFGVSVLKNISFSIASREKIGIVGRTGSGKSTLLVSLLRIVELVEGAITIDGVDISKLGLCQLRQQVAIIPQEPVLFLGTIRSNLDPFNRATDAEIWEALRSVHLSDAVGSLPKKLDSSVIENGKNFSLGQRQLFCIARAVLSKTRILVLDEATAAIDMKTDALIQTAIKKNFADFTVLTIAHRLNTIIESDKVLVMEAGQVVEFDEPIELLNRQGGHFASLVANTGEATTRRLRELAQASHDARLEARKNNPASRSRSGSESSLRDISTESLVIEEERK